VPAAFFLVDFWNDQLVEHDRQWLFLVLLGILLSFGFIRMSTRLMRSPRVPWWPGSVVSESGLHVHHLVFGIVLMMLAGSISFAGFATSPIYEICAVAFGVGIGLTIDEFALWVYLDDVYWKEEGRASVDAAVLAICGLGLILLGIRPFELEGGSVGAVVASIVTVALNLTFATICLLKQRLWHGTVGVFISPLSLYGALRLGKPGAAWARRRYGARNPEKQARSEARFPPDRRTERVKRLVRDALGGAPQEEYEAKLQRR
jgi:hypothetical protein